MNGRSADAFAGRLQNLRVVVIELFCEIAFARLISSLYLVLKIVHSEFILFHLPPRDLNVAKLRINTSLAL